MRGWAKSLDAAGAQEPGLREDSDRQRRSVRPFRRTAYLAARLLLPRPLLPHMMGATAELHFTGCATEADYQACLDAYSYPAVMLVAGLLTPEADDVPYRTSTSSTTSPRTSAKGAQASRSTRWNDSESSWTT
ncbi:MULTISPECIES: hypothetical protein [Streptomyces]|uniref:Uncharacterized protein n=1 Tax=Streptomyces murinus TaxID=33900 RepID=A0A7W3NV03_STRMR|nr:hypothetical protein [Streptomyces murinus]MBA9057189.1 hypothetical protein [Streptomyces murinus]